MTMQEIFDKAYLGLKGQGFIKSVADDRVATMWENTVDCRYRGAFDCRCAAGHILPDSSYDSGFEGSNVYGVDYFNTNFSGDVIIFIRELQSSHDSATSPEDMRDKLEEYAKDYDLVVPL